MNIPVLVISILLQFIAAFLALRLIGVTGKRKAWVLMAIALFLMGVRRCLTLFRLMAGDLPYPPDPAAELVELTISILMVAGMTWIVPLFLASKRSEEALRASGVPYTIVRPGGLVNKPGGTHALEFVQGDTTAGVINREDVALICIAALGNTNALGKTFETFSSEEAGDNDWSTMFGALSVD